MLKTIRDIVVSISAALILALVVIYFIRPNVVEGESMEPTLHNGDYVLRSTRAYVKDEPERGDIVVVDTDLTNVDGGGHKKLVKRVIGLPGESISIEDNRVTVDGEVLKEDYIKEKGVTPGYIHLTVPFGKVFLMGDNRANSLDSRNVDIGCVDISKITGRIFFKIMPFKDFGRI